MPELVGPSTALHRSYVAAMADFAAEGRGAEDDATSIGREIRCYAGRWDGAAGFAGFVAYLARDGDPDAERPAGRAQQITWWWADGDRYLGSIRLRPWPDAHVMEIGGHIGYDVAPAARRQGHATAMLGAVLPLATRLGLPDVVLTCIPDNAASRRVIESNGGVFEEERSGLRRYRITL